MNEYQEKKGSPGYKELLAQYEKREKKKALKKVVGICIVIIILMGLFPPWIHTFKKSGVYSEKPAQYSFIFSSQMPRSSAAGLRIDYGRLLLQWFMVLLASSLIIVFKKTKNVK